MDYGLYKATNLNWCCALHVSLRMNLLYKYKYHMCHIEMISLIFQNAQREYTLKQSKRKTKHKDLHFSPLYIYLQWPILCAFTDLWVGVMFGKSGGNFLYLEKIHFNRAPWLLWYHWGHGIVIPKLLLWQPGAVSESGFSKNLFAKQFICTLDSLFNSIFSSHIAHNAEMLPVRSKFFILCFVSFLTLYFFANLFFFCFLFLLLM